MSTSVRAWLWIVSSAAISAAEAAAYILLSWLAVVQGGAILGAATLLAILCARLVTVFASGKLSLSQGPQFPLAIGASIFTVACVGIIVTSAQHGLNANLLIIFALLVGLSEGMLTPSLQQTPSFLLHDDRASRWRRAKQNVSRVVGVVGTVVGALLLEFVGSLSLLILCASAGFIAVLSSLLLRGARPTPVGPPPRSDSWLTVASTILKSRQVLTLFTLMSGVAAFVLPLPVLLIPLELNADGANVLYLGLSVVCLAICNAAVVSRVEYFQRWASVAFVGCGACAAAMLLMALSPDPWFVVLLAGVVGMGLGLFTVGAGKRINDAVEPELMAQAQVALSLAQTLPLVVVTPIVAAIAFYSSPSVALFATGAAMMVATLAAVHFSRRSRV